MEETFHRRMLWIIVGVIIVVIGGFYALIVFSTPSLSLITVAAPKGGEQWEIGSTHIISWTTQNIPASDKISVSIRRIPPPPLQEEGQEFDPVIVTNLPNTGSAEWTIATMYPAGTYVLGLHAYEATPITRDISTESAPFQIVPLPLSQDLYPLYTKVDWNALQREIFTIATSSYIGTSISSVPVTNTMNPANIFTPFEKFYASKLAALGWKVDKYMAAGGHVGGQTGYRKDGELVLVRFNILYHKVPKNAPSACPCDVTLSLFSTK